MNKNKGNVFAIAICFFLFAMKAAQTPFLKISQNGKVISLSWSF